MFLTKKCFFSFKKKHFLSKTTVNPYVKKTKFSADPKSSFFFFFGGGGGSTPYKQALCFFERKCFWGKWFSKKFQKYFDKFFVVRKVLEILKKIPRKKFPKKTFFFLKKGKYFFFFKKNKLLVYQGKKVFLQKKSFFCQTVCFQKWTLLILPLQE